MPTHVRAGIRPAVWAGLLVLYVVWGSTYLGIRIAIETIPPFTMGAVRFFLAGGLLFAWSIARDGRTVAFPSRREWRDSFVVGALLLGGGMGMVAWGEQTVPSGIAALLIAMMPVWVAVLGRILLRERLPRAAAAGIAVGLVGVAILANPAAGSDRLDPAGVAALILSPILWASGSLYSAHRATLPSRPLVATAAQMLSGAIVLTAMALVSGEGPRVHVTDVSGESLAALAYLTLVGSILAFTVYGSLLRIAPLPLIATYAYVNPVVAVALGWVVLREPITPRTVVAGAIIVAAVAVIITARSRMAAPQGAARRPIAPTSSRESGHAAGRPNAASTES
jgi:drug/metabolite transporter (DMT)-like permease